MKLKNPLLAVTDMERSVAFYQTVLGLRKTMDFGANVTLTGGLSLQTCESWAAFLGKAPEELGWSGKVSEIYFEKEYIETALYLISTPNTGLFFAYCSIYCGFVGASEPAHRVLSLICRLNLQ